MVTFHTHQLIRQREGLGITQDIRKNASWNWLDIGKTNTTTEGLNPMTNDFEVASAVAELLKDLDQDRKTRVLRWVAESMGISPVATLPTTEPAAQDPGTPASFLPPSRSATDIKSFVSLKEPKSDNQFAAVVAYYYRFEAPANQKSDAITAETLQEATRLSGRSRLGDPGKTLRNAKDQGYLDAAERGAYKINTVGENLVAMTLPGGQARTSPAKTARKKPVTKKTKR